jgi:hypothetical protein
MKTKVKTVYYCDHCNKKYFIKSACEKHEERCYHNPKNKRPCLTCAHLTKKESTIYYDMYDGSEQSRSVDLLFCEKKQLFLYPPSVERKQNMFDLGDDHNKPMPNECGDYGWETNTN